MEATVDTAQPFRLHMGVDLGGADVRMAEKGLDGAQVRSAFEEMRGEGMTERVRRDGPPDAGLKGESLDALPDELTRERRPKAVDKEMVARRPEKRAPVAQIVAQKAYREAVQWHQAFLGALAENAYKAGLQVQVAHAEAAKFGHAQTGRIEELKHTAFTPAVPRVHVGEREEPFHFIAAQDFGQMLRQAGIFDQGSRVGGEHAFLHRVGKKGPQRGKAPCQGAPGIAATPHPGEIEKKVAAAGKRRAVSGGRLLIRLGGEQEKVFHIPGIGLNRARREAPLRQQMVKPLRKQKGEARTAPGGNGFGGHAAHASPDGACGQGGGQRGALGSGRPSTYTWSGVALPQLYEGERMAKKNCRTIAYVSLGSNCDDAAHMLDVAGRRLGALSGVEVTDASPVYSTEPQDYADQPWFLNQVLRLALDDPWRPAALVRALLGLEARMGRVRDPGLRFGPRVIDLDLLLFGDERCAGPDCTVPHPRLLRRAFVLVPLLDVAPGLAVDGLPLAKALQGLRYRVCGNKIFQ